MCCLPKGGRIQPKHTILHRCHPGLLGAGLGPYCKRGWMGREPRQRADGGAFKSGQYRPSFLPLLEGLWGAVPCCEQWSGVEGRNLVNMWIQIMQLLGGPEVLRFSRVPGRANTAGRSPSPRVACACPSHVGSQGGTPEMGPCDPALPSPSALGCFMWF